MAHSSAAFLTTSGLGDADSCACAGARLPLVSVGAAVPQRWPRLSRPDVPPFPTKSAQTETSADAPAFLAATARALGAVGPLAGHDYLTHAQRARRVARARARLPPGAYAARRDDTVNSLDAPSWMAKTLVEQHEPPALCDPARSWRAGARARVFLSPLVEVDPFTGRAPRALPDPARPAPGFIAGAEDRARIEAAFARSWGGARAGVTTAADVGDADAPRVARGAPAATLPARERFGATAAAAIGAPARGGALADTVGPAAAAAAGPVEVRPDGARARAEPPAMAYYAHRREAEGLPSLAEAAATARWTGVAPAELRAARGAPLAGPRDESGHALFRALTHAHGARAAQHLGAARGAAAAALGETGVLAAFPGFKSGPLHWYNVTR